MFWTTPARLDLLVSDALGHQREMNGPPEEGDGGDPGRACSTIWRFCREITEGDLVVLPLRNPGPAGRWVAVGIATGHAWTDNTQPAGARLRRPVSWITDQVPKDAPKSDLRDSVDSSLQTVFRSRVNAVAQRFLLLAYHADDPGPEGERFNDWTPDKRRLAWSAFERTKTLLPPVAISGDEAGVRSPNDDRIPEGAKSRVAVNRYERDPEARRRCLEYFKYTCQACGLNFEERYGKIGREYMVAHHIVPLSEIEDHENHTVHPTEDLVAVCPNCHAMLHRPKDKALLVSELVEMMNQAGESADQFD